MHQHAAHDHAHQAGTVLMRGLFFTLGFAIVEGVGGWWAGSLALLGDAGHMVTDATSLGMAAFAAWLATHPPSHRHSYGYARAEVIAALINGLLMLAVVAGIVITAIDRLRNPQPVMGGTVMLIAVAGLAVNIIVALMLSRGEQTLNTRAALLHVMGDLLGSVAALLSGVVITFTGWTPIDPILSIFICLLILFSAFRMLGETLHVIMEGVPLYLSLPEVRAAMTGVKRVHAVHDLHIWTLSSNKVALSAHVVIDDISCWQETLHELQHLLHDRFDIDHLTLQPETDMEAIQHLCESAPEVPAE
jgi:cobalt-zinc-cadmium efflux system protein